MMDYRFLNGEGIPQDTAVAKEWFQIAAAQGYEPARQKLMVLAHEQQQQQHRMSMASNSSSPPPTPQKKPNRWSALSLFGKKK